MGASTRRVSPGKGRKGQGQPAGSVAFYVMAAGFMITLALLFFGSTDLLRLAAAHRHLEAGLEASLRGTARLIPFQGAFADTNPYLTFDRTQASAAFRTLLARNLGLAEGGNGWEGELPHPGDIGGPAYCRNRLLDGSARYRLQIESGPRSEVLVAEVWAPVRLAFVGRTVTLHVRRQVLPQPVPTTRDGRSAGATDELTGRPEAKPPLSCGGG